MENLLKTILPLLAIFLGLLAIFKYYINKLENKISILEDKIEKLEKNKLNNLKFLLTIKILLDILMVFYHLSLSFNIKHTLIHDIIMYFLVAYNNF